jgi:hypothetical protein
MRASALTGAAAAATALAIVLSGCGSDKESGGSSSSSSSSASSSATSAESSAAKPSSGLRSDAPEAPAAGGTVADYINQNGITQVVVKPGEDGAPNVELPTPDSWALKNDNLPDGAYGGVAYTGADANPEFPPTIFAYLSRLDGPADPAEILGAAPNEVLGLEGFEGTPGEAEKLSGFDAFEIAGQYMQDGKPTFVAQKTVVIPGPEALYMLQLNAYSTPEQQDKLGAAMGQIDHQTQISF